VTNFNFSDYHRKRDNHSTVVLFLTRTTVVLLSVKPEKANSLVDHTTYSTPPRVNVTARYSTISRDSARAG
jgi:hypothetical protein